MASRTTVELIDDLDPTVTADATVQFALDGTAYEVDLSAAPLRQALERYVAAARRQGSTRPARSARPGAAQGGTGTAVDNQAVRAWARAQGEPVSDRGRVRSALVSEFQEATAS